MDKYPKISNIRLQLYRYFKMSPEMNEILVDFQEEIVALKLTSHRLLWDNEFHDIKKNSRTTDIPAVCLTILEVITNDNVVLDDT